MWVLSLAHTPLSFLLISIKEGKEAEKKHIVVWNKNDY